MKREVIKPYINKEVKLVQKDNWCLYGKIVNLDDDSLIFRTTTRESIISLDFIATIIPRE